MAPYDLSQKFPFWHIPQVPRPSALDEIPRWARVRPDDPASCDRYADYFAFNAVDAVRCLRSTSPRFDPHELVALSYCGLLGAMGRFRKEAHFVRGREFWSTAMIELMTGRDRSSPPLELTTLASEFIGRFLHASRRDSAFPKPSTVLRGIGWNWSKAFVLIEDATPFASLVGTFGLRERETRGSPDDWRRVFGKIGDREAAVLRMRHGMDGHRRLTLQEIGEVGPGGFRRLSRERVRQIEDLALRRLFRDARAAGLLPFSLDLVFAAQG